MNKVDQVTSNEADEEDPIAHLRACQQEWRACAGHERFTRLLAALYAVLQQTIVEPARARGAFALGSPVRGSPLTLSFSIRHGEGGELMVTSGKWSMPLEDLVHDFWLDLARRYQADAHFAVTSGSYLRSGLALRAQTACRPARRRDALAGPQALGADDADGPGAAPATNGSSPWVVGSATQSDELVSDAETREDSLRKLRLLWFHAGGCPRSPAAWRCVPGLSLRYCYAALRLGSGAMLTQIAAEIGVHPSRLSRLARELCDFRPGTAEGEFLRLGDSAAMELDAAAIAAVGLGPRSGVDLLRPADAEAAARVRVAKAALWATYLFAREELLADAPSAGARWIPCRPPDAQDTVEVQVESLAAPGAPRAVRLRQFRVRHTP